MPTHYLVNNNIDNKSKMLENTLLGIQFCPDARPLMMQFFQAALS